MDKYVYICYGNGSEGKAKSLIKILNNKGINVCTASSASNEAVDKPLAILDAIRSNKCIALILLLNKDAVDSPWVVRELERGFAYDKVIIPLQLEKVDYKDFSFCLGQNAPIRISYIGENNGAVRNVVRTIHSLLGTKKATVEHMMRPKIGAVITYVLAFAIISLIGLPVLFDKSTFLWVYAICALTLMVLTLRYFVQFLKRYESIRQLVHPLLTYLAQMGLLRYMSTSVSYYGDNIYTIFLIMVVVATYAVFPPKENKTDPRHFYGWVSTIVPFAFGFYLTALERNHIESAAFNIVMTLITLAATVLIAFYIKTPSKRQAIVPTILTMVMAYAINAVVAATSNVNTLYVVIACIVNGVIISGMLYAGATTTYNGTNKK